MGAFFIPPNSAPCGIIPEPATIEDARHCGAPIEPDTAAAARTLHLRSQLEEAAKDGTALLAALGLPRLVTPDFDRVEISTVGDALDTVIHALDALDEPGEDLEDGGDDEPWLGWTQKCVQSAVNIGGTLDIEHYTADGEPSLASPERHPEVPEHPCSWEYRDIGPNSR